MHLLSKTTALFFLLVTGLIGCRVPYSDHGDDDGGTDDTGTDTGDPLPDAGPGGTCPENSWDQFDNSVSPYIGGNKEVKVEVSIATDFHCPWCLVFAMEMLDLVEKEEFEDFVRIYLHHYPLNIHPDVWEIHYAAVAVHNQSFEKFWTLHDTLFLNENEGIRWTIDEVVEFADSVLELDMDQFHADRKSQETFDFITYEKEQASKQGLTGTPSVWVCGTKISWGQLEETVNMYLEGGGSDSDSDTDTDADTDTDTDTDTDVPDGGL